jgi:hypothetical protein
VFCRWSQLRPVFHIRGWTVLGPRSDATASEEGKVACHRGRLKRGLKTIQPLVDDPRKSEYALEKRDGPFGERRERKQEI